MLTLDLSVLRPRVDKLVQTHQLRRNKRYPAGMFLRQPVRHRPPSAGVQPQAHMAGENLDILGVRVDMTRRLNAALPRHHTVRARKNTARRHRGCHRQVVIRVFDSAVAPRGQLVNAPSVGRFG